MKWSEVIVIMIVVVVMEWSGVGLLGRQHGIALLGLALARCPTRCSRLISPITWYRLSIVPHLSTHLVSNLTLLNILVSSLSLLNRLCCGWRVSDPSEIDLIDCKGVRSMDRVEI